MASSGAGCCSWMALTLALSTLGVGPFGKGPAAGELLLLNVDNVAPVERWLSGACLFESNDAVVWDLLFLDATTTAGGPPLTSKWLFKAVVVLVVVLFFVWLYFVARLAEWLLHVIFAVSLVVLLFSTFVAARQEEFFSNAAPSCSQGVRHRGGTDGEEEQSAASS